MSMNDKNKLIHKLEVIFDLYNKASSITRKMSNFEPEDHYERKVKVPVFPGEYKNDSERKTWETLIDHRDEDAVQQMEAKYDKFKQPKEPRKPDLGKCPGPSTALVTDFKQKKGWQVWVSGFVLACALISGGLFSGEALTIILNLVLIAVCGFVIYRFYKVYERLKKADAEVSQMAIEGYEQEKREKKEKYEADMKEYQSLLNSYKLSKDDFIEAYIQWRTVYLEHLQEEAVISEKLEEDRLAAVQKIEAEEFTPVLEEMAEINDLVTPEYLSSLDVIIDLLKSGRADGLKEAINLYEDIIYRERQLQLEREKEEQRRYEEEQRRRDEERHYREEMRFREQQERNRQREAEQQMRIQEKQHQDQMKFQENQERQRQNEAQQQLRMQAKQHQDQMKFQENQEKQRKKEAEASRQKRCAWCAHYPSCNMTNHNAAYNCTGFRPR